MPTPDTQTFEPPLEPTRKISNRVNQLQFDNKVEWVYNPLDYAWNVHSEYLTRFGTGPKRAVFLGMNPGPWGMAQTGVPFGDTTIAGDWLGLRGLPIGTPEEERPDRPVIGWDLERQEGSGQRLFGFFRKEMGSLPAFFQNNFVLNYLPLVMFNADGKNVTPARLLKADRLKVFEACDPYLQAMVDYYQPEVLVGIGKFALRRLEANFSDTAYTVVDIPHPSPASPIATRDGGRYWNKLVTETLQEVNILPA